MKPPSGPKKQTQFKPNFFKGQNELKIACRKIRPHPGGLSEILLRLKPTVAFISNNYSPKPVSAIPGKEARQNAAKQVRQRKKVRILSHIPPNFELKNGSGFGLQGSIRFLCRGRHGRQWISPGLVDRNNLFRTTNRWAQKTFEAEQSKATCLWSV